jgi:hypothetical protein
MNIRPIVVTNAKQTDIDVGLWSTRLGRALPGLVLPVYWSDEEHFMSQFLGYDISLPLEVLVRSMVRNKEVN